MVKMPIDTPQLFAELYTVFQAGERALTGVRSLRSAARVYDALDAASEDVKNGAGQVVGRQLVEGRALVLETAEWDLFRDVVTRVAENGAQGAGRVLDARRSLVLLEALERAEKMVDAAAPHPPPTVGETRALVQAQKPADVPDPNPA